jgi:hypothetical protein
LAHVLVGEPVPTSPEHALGVTRRVDARGDTRAGAANPDRTAGKKYFFARNVRIPRPAAHSRHRTEADEFP